MIPQIAVAFLIILWLVSGPAYLVWRGRFDFMLDILGMYCKVLMVAVAKDLIVRQDFNKLVALCIILTLYMVIYLIFRGTQLRGHAKKGVVKAFNFRLDFVMWIVVSLSGYLALLLTSVGS